MNRLQPKCECLAFPGERRGVSPTCLSHTSGLRLDARLPNHHIPKNGTGNRNACCSYKLHTPFQLVYCVKNTIVT